MINISLKCPLGLTRIKVPCRTTDCKHLQCFDGVNFLNIFKQSSKWKCPICNASGIICELVADEYFNNILNSPLLPSTDTEVVVNADGSWRPSSSEKIIVSDEIIDLTFGNGFRDLIIDLTFSNGFIDLALDGFIYST